MPWKDESLHKDQRRAIYRRYYVKHRDARVQYARDHRPPTELKSQWAKESYLRHADAIKERVKSYQVANPEKTRAIHRRWATANPTKVKVSALKYRRSHLDQLAVKSSRRRAKKAGNGGSHTVAEWRDKCALLGNVCFYCGEAKPLEREHKIPIVRGGTDDISNIVPACRSCNSRKHTKTAREFLNVA